jgi:hypothetical protein
MLELWSALVSGVLMQAAAAPAVDVDAATNEATAFVAALTAREYEQAEKKVAPLVKRFVELGKAAESADRDKEAPSRDLAASCRKARRQIAEGFLKAVKEPRATAHLQQTVLSTFGVVPDDGEKLDVAALNLDSITEVPDSLAAAIRSLGTFRKTKYVELFEKQLADGREAVINAGAHALGEFFGEKEELRKQIVGKMISAYESVGVGSSGSFTTGAKGSVDQTLMMKVRYEFQLALARLTGGVQHDRARLWAEWYRNNKNGKWRDGIDKPAIKFDGLEPGPAPSKPSGH